VKVFLVSFLYAPFIAGSQTVRSPVASPYIGFGAYSNKNVDIFSSQSNQASLAQLKQASAGVYGEKRFLLNELGLYDAVLAVPTRSGNFGLAANYYGFSDYNESQIGLAYGRSLGSKVDVGVQFNYYAVRIAGYGNASVVNFELGTILHLTDHVNAGLHVYNPLSGKLTRDEEERLASVYSAGFGYEPTENFFVGLEIRKEENKPVDVNAGFQYQFLSQLLIRLGISAATSTMFLGFGFKWRSMRLDATASYHPQLGITPGLLLAMRMNRKQESKLNE
jgi:hypothetical protein